MNAEIQDSSPDNHIASLSAGASARLRYLINCVEDVGKEADDEGKVVV